MELLTFYLCAKIILPTDCKVCGELERCEKDRRVEHRLTTDQVQALKDGYGCMMAWDIKAPVEYKDPDTNIMFNNGFIINTD